MARTLSRYDLILAVVAASLAGVAVLTATTSVPLRVSAAGATVVSGTALYEAMVRNPPTDGSS